MNIIIEEIVSEFPVEILEEVVQITISDAVSYFDIIEVADTDFVGKNGYVPVVDEATGKLVLEAPTGGGGGVSNLSLTANPTNHVVSNTNGTGFTTPLADDTNAGLITSNEKGLIASAIQLSSLNTWWTGIKTLAQTIAGKWTFTNGLVLSPLENPTYEKGLLFYDNLTK